MTPEQKLASIRKAVDDAFAANRHGTAVPVISATWLDNLLNLPPSPFGTTDDDPDMVDVIKNQMQLHAADCETNKTSITREYKGCNCWLADSPKPSYTVFRIKPKDPYTKIIPKDFDSRSDAIEWLKSNTLFSLNPEFDIYWEKFYDIIEKEPTTK
jgi:hypothetical protein